MRWRVQSLWCVWTGAVGLIGCGDPTVDSRVDALGPEVPGVPQGPEHRPGQPCVTCHQDSGPGSPDFSVAGTVYQDKEGSVPLVGARFDFVDADGRSYSVSSNCVGSFYIESDEWNPRFPLWVRLVYGDRTVAMETPIRRERSCATCHGDPAGPAQVGHVYLFEEPLGASLGDCR